MNLFLSLLPLYLLGNFHCFSMCGPLVMWLGRHPHRYAYLWGRLCSFTVAGFLAGSMGVVVQTLFHAYHVAEGISLGGGLALISWGLLKGQGKSLVQSNAVPGLFHRLLQRLSGELIKRESRSALFWMGFLTLALPCGQIVVVFSSCALYGDPWVGGINGAAFALLTTPSLLVALYAVGWPSSLGRHERKILAGSAILTGTLSCCRGLAEGGWIEHVSLSSPYHLVLF